MSRDQPRSIQDDGDFLVVVAHHHRMIDYRFARRPRSVLSLMEMRPKSTSSLAGGLAADSVTEHALVWT